MAKSSTGWNRSAMRNTKSETHASGFITPGEPIGPPAS
jgi:hypothetical protein